jgi:membrane fusion protein, multidrug efflux system
MSEIGNNLIQTEAAADDYAAAKHKRRGWVGYGALAVAVVLIITGGGFFLTRSEASKTKPAEIASSVPTVNVIVAHRGKAEQEVVIPGSVKAFEEAPIYARVAGFVKKWYVDIGDSVKAGQLLAEIETPELDIQLQQSEEILGQVRAKLNLARITAERYQGLLKDQAVSEQEVDERVAEFQARKADYAAAQSETRRLKEMKSFQKVYAPFNGKVGSRNLDKAARGALIDAGSRDPGGWLYKIYQVDVLRVFVAVPQNYVPMIREGGTADVLVTEFPDRVFPGKVTRKSSTMDPSSLTLLTEVQVPNKDGKLYPGMYAKVGFRMSDPTPPIVVPGAAVISGGEGPRVAVVDDKGMVSIRKVQLGRDLGKTIEIVSGCAEGERLVMNPSDTLHDGSKVVAVALADSRDAGAQPAAPAPAAGAVPSTPAGTDVKK